VSSQQPLSQQFCPAVQHCMTLPQQVLLQHVTLPLASWQQLSPSAQHRDSAQQVPPGAQHWPLQTVAARAPSFRLSQQPSRTQLPGLQHCAEAPVPHSTWPTLQHFSFARSPKMSPPTQTPSQHVRSG
jgi:hypothetical protein